VQKSLKACSRKTALDDPWFATDAFDGIAELLPEVMKVEATQVPQLDPFELLPNALVRIQLRGIRGQALQMEPLGRSVGQELFDEMAAVNGGAIPDNDHTTGDLPQHMLQEGYHVLRIEGALLDVEIEFSLRGDGADGREMITRPPLPQDGSLAHRGIGADDTGQGIKPRFVYEQDCLLLRLRPFLRAGQVSSRQWAIAASSRCRARRAGFCGLQRMAWHKRLT
jgi:hypothetical protein